MSLGELPISSTFSGYWKMFSNANDSTANANNGTSTAATFAGTAGILSGVTLTGVASSRIDLPANTSMKKTTFTMSLWFNQSTSGMAIGFRKLVSSKFYGHACQLNVSGSLTSFVVGVYGGTGNVAGTDYVHVNSIKTYTTGIWHNIIYTYDGSNIKVYVNGVLDNSGAWSGGCVYDATSTFKFGCLNDSSSTLNTFYGGKLDEIIYDSKIWTASQVRKYYTQAKGRFQTIQ